MFYQVLVPEDQQKFLRFVYWPDGDLSKDLEDYQMCAHLFGAKSSTSCCIFALMRAAMDHEENYSPDVCDIILNNFYMDDMLKSFPSDEIAIAQISKVIELCKESGLCNLFLKKNEQLMTAKS